MQIETVPLADLHLDPANARKHGEINLESIIGSLRRFGQAEPLVVHARSGRVIGGNGRLVAMQKLGWKTCEIVRVDLDDLEATALGIALNRTAELAEWNEDTLAKLLANLKAEGAIDGTGFSDEDIDQLLADVEPEIDPDELSDDDIPEPPDEAVTLPGDLWVLGDHRLLCGDSSKVEDVDRLVSGEVIDLVNTDPPYNVKVEPRSNNAIAAGLSSFGGTHHQSFDAARDPGKKHRTDRKLRAKDRPLENDFVTDEEFDRLLRAWFGNASRVLKPGGSFYIWGGYANLGNYPPALAESSLYFSQAIIWDKQHPVLTRKDYMGAFEVAFHGWKKGAGHKFYGPNNATDLWHIKKVSPQKMCHLCLHPDSKVMTTEGFRAISTIQPGDRVYSGDGTFNRVSHVSSHPYTSDHLYRITAKGGNATTDASDNHPFLIWRPTRKRGAITSAEVAWLRADELKAGDYTLTPVLDDEGRDPYPERDEEYWFLFGLYLAEGHLQRAGHGERKYPVFSINKARQDLAERIWKRWPNSSEYDPNDYNQAPTGGLTVMAFDGDVGQQFEELGGHLCYGKRLAPEIFELPRSKRLAVLTGWLNGDGCKVHNRTYWQGNTVSPDLAAHLMLLGESVGYRTNIFSYDPPDDLGGIGGRAFKSRRTVYHLYFYERKQVAKRGSPLWLEHEGRDYSLRYIKKVEQIRYEGEVCNLSVEGHPSFLTSVGLSHNTEKPIELAARAILYSSQKNERVLDLFGGSGSTLMACQETGRRGYLMELDRLYSDVIVTRWQNATEKDAIHEATGKTFNQIREERLEN